MEFITKTYNCPLCKKDDTALLLQKQGFTIVKCRHCGFIYVNPRVADEALAGIYEHNYFQNKDYGYAGYEQEKRLRIKNFEKWLTDAGLYVTGNRTVTALDVGCAAGYCLDVMKSKGWDATGLELDAEMCNALEKAGHTVYRVMLENFERRNHYDIITLFDVIEHITQLDTAFAKLHTLLADNGIVVLVTPDHNSFQRKVFGKRWFQYKPIEHIQYFTRETLAAFAERNGLQMVYYSRCGQYADAQFILNRLSYYRFSLLSKFFKGLFSVFRLKNKFFYTDTGSLFVVLKKK